ncbi:MAG TPA: ribosome biogenesis factor YjgA [Steroidobacteraceae bacterium]|nr:ribosome biogenesis factor YjgA [Steroidobacteraceae bacterium]
MARRNHDDTAGNAGNAGTTTAGTADADASAPQPSRSARKRHAIALQKLGVRLTSLKSVQLHSLALPEELLAAVLEAQRLRSRPALARQQQYIGRLMRQIDPGPIERALDATLHR